MRGVRCLIVVWSLMLVGCRANPPGGDTLAYDDLSYTQPEVNDTARRRLAAPVRLDAGSATLVDVARLIQRQTGVPVRFQWDGLAELGVGPDEVIEFEPGTLPADRLLATLLLEIAPPKAPSSWEVYATYLLVDGTAVVGTNRSLKPLAAAVDWPGGETMAIDEDEAVRRMLRDTIITTDEQNISLAVAVQMVREATELSVVVNWPALDIVGVDRDALVFPANASRADHFLHNAMRQVGADTFDEDQPGYTIAEGAVVITTLGEMKSRAETRVYDVRDLVDRPFGPLLETAYADDEFALALLRKYELAWFVDLGRIKAYIEFNDGYRNFDVVGPNVNTRPDDFHWPDPINDRAEVLEQVAQLIQDTTGDVDDWLDEQATLRELNGLFIIKATEQTHEEIAVLLDRLRETRGARVYQFMRDLDVARLLMQAEALRAGGDYEGALEVAEAAVAVDPASIPARGLRDVLADTIARNRARTGGD